VPLQQEAADRGAQAATPGPWGAPCPHAHAQGRQEADSCTLLTTCTGHSAQWDSRFPKLKSTQRLPRTGRPARWWMPHPWDHSRPGWTGLWAAWSGWRCPCSLQGLGWVASEGPFPPKPVHDSILRFHEGGRRSISHRCWSNQGH